MQRSLPRELIYSNGERRIFLKTGSETNGEMLEMEVTYLPNSERPITHFHPHQEEDFKVLTGNFRVYFDGKERTYRVGETFTIPVRSHHWMYNTSTGVGRLNWKVRPALKTQEFFTSLWRAQDKAGRRPGMLQSAVLLDAYKAEFIPSLPPVFIQRILFGILTPIGRMFGYRP